MKKIFGGLAVLLTAACLSSPMAKAVTLCASGATNSFGPAVTLNLTGTCTVSGINFSNFAITGENTFVPTVFSAIATSDDATSTLGFSFTSLVSPAGVGDIFLTFQSDQPLSAILLGGGSTTSIIETVCSAGFNSENCTGNVLGSNTSTGGGTVTVNITGAKGITFFGKDILGGSGLTQGLTGVPEPASLSMMGFGLLGLGLIGRRKRKV